MAGKKRSYEDYCAAAHALDLIGERWALLIVRELLLGPRRFTDLRAGLPAISPNVLTQRLNDMEASGVLRRRRLPRPASAWVYELTPWGLELEPIVLGMTRWGVRSPAFERGKAISADALVLSLKAMFQPAAAQACEADIGLAIENPGSGGSAGDSPGTSRDRESESSGNVKADSLDRADENRQIEHYRARISGGQLQVVRGYDLNGLPARIQAEITAQTPALLALAYGGLDPAQGRQAGMLTYQGNLDALRCFFSMFSLPPRADDMGT